jgi:hypothetical protein
MSRKEKVSDRPTSEPTPTPINGTQHGNRPLRVFRARGVSVAVFENLAVIEGRQVTFLKAELRRVYRDGDEFKTTHALSVHDVPVARLLLEQAFAFMLEANQERAESASESSG